ncbi:hypothetical protein RJT34_31240 [Clitoria ternatea]|uniref:Uncharacterized protein n=1 Tax=Clitoria ternatea TaxID=43366 RepID=A0AAN9EUN7_CLITE
MAEASSRDSRRRRRILEQGSDRLAFITGRIQSLPDPTTGTYPCFQFHLSITFLISLLLFAVDDHSDSSSQIHQASPSPKHHEGITEISTAPTSQPDPPQNSLAPPPPPQLVEKPKLFITPSDITSAINASKVTRLCCSLLVAIVTVASHLDFSFPGTSLVKSVLGFRPLYLVLVTNLTVVVATLVSGIGRRFYSPGDGGKWGALATTLELGVLLQNVADAVFMDCAVYAIVLVCSLSLLRT